MQIILMNCNIINGLYIVKTKKVNNWQKIFIETENCKYNKKVLNYKYFNLYFHMKQFSKFIKKNFSCKIFHKRKKFLPKFIGNY